MLASEVRGTIEQPDQYFDTTNVNRFKDLDALLLTQGWRDFTWKYLSDTTLSIKYPHESGFTIAGTLTTNITHKPKINTNITLGLHQKGEQFFAVTKSDALGRYQFKNLDFTGSNVAILSADKTGIITKDNTSFQPLSIHYCPTRVKPLIEESTVFKDNFFDFSAITKGNGLPVIFINEVNVIDKKQTVNPSSSAYYETPNWSAQISEQDYSSNNPLLFLNGRVPGMQVRTTNSPDTPYMIIYRGGNDIVYLLDGMQVNQLTILDIPMEIIDKIEFLNHGIGFFGMDGTISVTTKKFENRSQSPDWPNVLRTTLQGFYQSRVFYAPTYELHQLESTPPDVRATLFWQPNVITDENGMATVTFYNDDKTSPVLITAEGMIDKRKPVVCVSGYQVRK
jgi:hypothetical protein